MAVLMLSLSSVDNHVPRGSDSVYTEVTVYDDDNDIVMGGKKKANKNTGVPKEGNFKVPENLNIPNSNKRGIQDVQDIGGTPSSFATASREFFPDDNSDSGPPYKQQVYDLDDDDISL
jgi:hypothetical protein